jgi:hypothetical protein
VGHFPQQFITHVLVRYPVFCKDIVHGEHTLTQWIRNEFFDAGWPKHVFTVAKYIDGEPQASVSHEIDHVKSTTNGKIALEIEWNNKDPFFDRDLENFQEAAR